MASDLSFVEFVAEQIEHAGEIRFRKMFGEYALYCNEKVVALICDNQLYVKPTKSGREYIGQVIEAPPYPGAKLYFLIEDQIEDRNWIGQLIKLTAEELVMDSFRDRKLSLCELIKILKYNDGTDASICRNDSNDPMESQTGAFMASRQSNYFGIGIFGLGNPLENSWGIIPV